MKTRTAVPALLAAALGLACARGGPAPDQLKQYLSQPQMQVKSYAFDPASPLESRLGPCPEMLLAWLREIDDKPGYRGYAPSAAEKRLVLELLAALPERMKQAFQERLLGIYFVEDFTGNGMSNWVLDESGQVHAWLVVNPAAFKKSLSETLTAREASVFKGGGVKVDCGTRYRGVVYTILHEGLHVYDFVRGVTPYVEEAVVHAARGGKGLGASWDVWESLKKPRPEADFPFRDELRFYGMNGGPSIRAADAAKVYLGLMRSPFPSLYASQSWAEDAAELFTFHHITSVLKQPYVIRLAGPRPASFEPMRSGHAAARARRLYGPFYEPAAAK
ncbi:MAG: hypothetical protein HY926_09855 [Elusimicrobia bacterium]|nr:hypothetical protein [Elusimicrobiota bacterium]